MKKLLSILLLSCLFLQIAGFYFVFLVRRQAIKQEVKAYLRSHRQTEEQQVFTISLSGRDPADPAIQWEEADEFSFNGTMYDVIEKKLAGEHWEIRCISDEKETTLIKDFEKDLSANTAHGNPGKANGLIKLITAPFIAIASIDTASTSFIFTVYNEPCLLQLPDIIFEIPTPPPQVG